MRNVFSPRVDGGRRWVQLAHEFYRQTNSKLLLLLFRLWLRFNFVCADFLFFFQFHCAKNVHVSTDFFSLILITKAPSMHCPRWSSHRQLPNGLHVVDRHRLSSSSVWRRFAGWVVSFFLFFFCWFCETDFPSISYRATDWFKTEAMYETVAMDCALQFLCKFSPL